MTSPNPSPPSTLPYCALAGLIMAYGWGYRGTVGHEAGAMVPGAMLGLALALGSGRTDWHRRSAVVGLFAAAGFAWGGSLSYMEQTLYALSDSFPDVLFGYTMLVFLGGIWAGIGGGAIGLALTEPRSELEKYARLFTLTAAVFLLVYLYLFFNTDHRENLETFTVRHFHDGDWLPALLVLILSGFYWAARPKDRSATLLFLTGAAAWWIGYLVLTKFGGLRLGPLHRSESWGGVLGILVALIIHLHRRHNRAAVMTALYGILGGGIGFAAAVFLRHPLAVQWGPIAAWPPMPQWRIAEDLFGLFMGVALALGSLRLLRGGLRRPSEDVPRAPLDVYSVFAILIGLLWVNFRRHFAPSLALYESERGGAMLGLPLWGWYVVGGAFATAPVLLGLRLYLRGDRTLVPATAYGKGSAIALVLAAATVVGYNFHETPRLSSMVGHLVLWVPAFLACCLIVQLSPGAERADPPSGEAAIGPDDPSWRPGRGYWMLWGATPIFLLAITAGSLAMQEGPHEMGRKRFGPDAYWRQTARLVGEWRAIGLAQSLGGPTPEGHSPPVVTMEFDSYRNVSIGLPSGERVENSHRWFLKNQYNWLHWHSKAEGHPERAEVPLQFREGRLYIAWPPDRQDEGYLVLERVE